MRTRASILLALLLLGGCSYFQKHERLNLSPFAEYTVNLAAEIEYGASQIKTPRLRVYRDDPRLVAHREYWEKVRTLLRGVVAYSIEISTLGSSSLDGPERNERFAVFLDRLLRPPLTELREIEAVRFTTADLDTMLVRIRGEERFLDGLREAQPFIDELARVADLLFDVTQDDLDATFAHVDDRIAADNQGAVETWASLLVAQERIFVSLGELRLYQTTNETSHLDTLYESEPELHAIPREPLAPTPEEQIAMRTNLTDKLRLGVDLKDLLRPDLDRYYAQQEELDEIYNYATTQLKRARLTVIVWARAHRNLADGVTDPARIDVFNLTRSAVKGVF